MKTVILAVNSKYVHTLLAPRYLKANCIGQDVSIYETNVNARLNDVISDIYLLSPDVIAISTYIFNISFVRSFLSEIRLVLPKLKIILGGWEAAFDTEGYLDVADYIIKGEGDLAFSGLLTDIENGACKERIVDCGTVCDLDKIVSPYDDEYAALGKDKILYIETTRGCPFSCGYCMSGRVGGVRSFSLPRVFEDIKRITKYSPGLVKFVDRTFNYDKKRATLIFEHLIDNYSDTNTCFHFEMAPELFDEPMLECLSRARKGIFQFEIGVQSYNPITLKAVNRPADLKRIDENLKKIIALKNINVHVDLISGLPFEDMKSFKSGFNRLISLGPDDLQLGFLKLLKGSALSECADDFICSALPPYEVYCTKWLSYDDIIVLKGVEEMLEVFYNSKRFGRSIRYLILKNGDAFELFNSMNRYFNSKGVSVKILSAFHKCDELFDFGKGLLKSKEDVEALQSYIEEDFESSGNCRKWHKVP